MGEIVTHFFTGMSVQASIGIHAAEKAGPQRILIDLEYDLAQPEDARDDLADHLDYDEIRNEVESIVRNRHFNMQETLCREILAGIMTRKQVIRAKISTRKPDIYPDCDAVGVTLERRKAAT